MVLFAMSGATNPVASIACTALWIYWLCILAVIILSWFPLAPGGPAYSAMSMLRRLTDPVLLPLRRLIPPIGGMFDLSPIIVLVLLQVIRAQIC